MNSGICVLWSSERYIMWLGYFELSSVQCIPRSSFHPLPPFFISFEPLSSSSCTTLSLCLPSWLFPSLLRQLLYPGARLTQSMAHLCVVFTNSYQSGQITDAILLQVSFTEIEADGSEFDDQLIIGGPEDDSACFGHLALKGSSLKSMTLPEGVTCSLSQYVTQKLFFLL